MLSAKRPKATKDTVKTGSNCIPCCFNGGINPAGFQFVRNCSGGRGINTIKEPAPRLANEILHFKSLFHGLCVYAANGEGVPCRKIVPAFWLEEKRSNKKKGRQPSMQNRS
jgi:hypothetical protein